MTILNRLERKIGWIAIGHLPIYIVSAQAVLTIWVMMNPGQFRYLILDPAAVFYGREYFRLLTFLFVIPVRSPIFAVFYLYLLYIYGSALETEWGSFSFTLFYLTGALGTVLASVFFGSVSGAFYLNLTIFLAFAVLNPNFVLYLFFILPVKIKWLAWITWAGLLYELATKPFFIKAAILVSLANYFLFFTKSHMENTAEFMGRMKHKWKFRNWNK